MGVVEFCLSAQTWIVAAFLWISVVNLLETQCGAFSRSQNSCGHRINVPHQLFALLFENLRNVSGANSDNLGLRRKLRPRKLHAKSPGVQNLGLTFFFGYQGMVTNPSLLQRRALPPQPNPKLAHFSETGPLFKVHQLEDYFSVGDSSVPVCSNTTYCVSQLMWRILLCLEKIESSFPLK